MRNVLLGGVPRLIPTCIVGGNDDFKNTRLHALFNPIVACRSAFPLRKNFPYLERIGLKSVLTLILEEYPAANVSKLR